MPDRDESGEDALGWSGSMADLFFALSALCIFLVVALVPSIRAGDPSPVAAELPSRSFGAGEPVVFVAETGGLRLPGGTGRLVTLDAMLDDRDLAERLRAAEGEALLVIGEDGQEASFLFGSLASGLGLSTFRQIRLPRPCARAVPSPDDCASLGRESGRGKVRP